MMWSLYENQKFLEPLKFSNGKSQDGIVQEVIEASNQGYKLIFIKGVCGTGKSAIALNLANHFGKTSIVVPIKSLQEQYINDYTDKKYILRDNKRLIISSILGRKNFKCKFLEENSNSIDYSHNKEKNAKLFDIFKDEVYKKDLIKNEEDKSADNNLIPCKIEIKEKNLPILKNYLKQNDLIKKENISSMKDFRRINIAPACKYYSPILEDNFDFNFKDGKKLKYKGLMNKQFAIHQRENGCKYYEQYKSYLNSDVIIFNSSKYLLETLMNRKPETELEIIDECDEFLDNFAEQEKININKLLFGLSMIITENDFSKNILENLLDLANTIKRKYDLESDNEVLSIEPTPIKELLLTILKNSDFISEIVINESNYLFHLEEVATKFSNIFKDTYFNINKENNDLIINLVTTNLKDRFKEIIKKNKLIVMMSGTIHSEMVLKNIYGLENFKIINAETELQGTLENIKIGYEFDCKYENFKSGKFSRENFLKSFSSIVNFAKPPVLIHLTSFQDLPDEMEKYKYNLDLPTQKDIIKEQDLDPLGKKIQEFKEGKFQRLYTTKCNRGIDFPGELCNSIIISRFPYPNISSLFWKILRKKDPNNFMNFYMDKAKRELVQRIYRGLRSKDDKLYLLSPDIRVLNYQL
ncbi:MAG: helicase C-terminal domain-containing protein [Nanoarchaeota archaeon]